VTTAIAHTNGAAMIADGFTNEQVQLIKDQVCVGGTDNELKLFLYQAKRMGLDPLARQIYAIKRGPKMSIQVSIDGFRLIADRSGKYAPGRAATFEEKGNQIVSATAYVNKLVAGSWHEVSATAYWSEYAQQSPMWQKMPRTMIAKCAESLALRKAFPAELSGVYSDSEMEQADTPHAVESPAQIHLAAPITRQLADTDKKKDEQGRAMASFWINVREAAQGQGIPNGDVDAVVHFALDKAMKLKSLTELNPVKLKGFGARLSEPGKFAELWSEWCASQEIPRFDDVTAAQIDGDNMAAQAD
jgi:phage recombination protein Bet